MRDPARSSIETRDYRGRVDGLAGVMERRSRLRFPVELRVRLRTLGRGDPVTGIGRVLNMSSGGVLVAHRHEVIKGTQVELSIDWPTRLDGRVPLQLVAFGTVVRCELFSFAVGLERHQFRIARRTDIPTDESYGASGQQRAGSA